MTEKKTVGIVSGGQLGRMLTEEAIKLGFKVIVLDPAPNCPAAQVGAEQIVGSWKDGGLISEVIEKSDFFTIEIEHIDTDVLKKYKDKNINPLPETIELIQNKYEQKKFLARNKIPTAEFKEVSSFGQAEEIFEKFGKKAILKSKKDAYDGRGNRYIDSAEALKQSFEEFAGREIYIEKIINFKKELAVMAARDIHGKIVSYPVVETVHERNICTYVYAPAKIDESINENAKNLAEKVVASLDGAGVYGVEMFLDEENNILINEIAPRVHNSGHYTMDGCETSQFEQHIRAITGMGLSPAKMSQPSVAMVNILGERDGPVELKGVEEAESIKGVKVYIYGKSPTKVDRKMGHINAVAGTIEEAIDKARKARSLISI
ncbi:MAG TPA: 5-(carboxyamino)imidazole ribonucleotide synthase [Candidatus Saccharimonadales bacterium]|nr:5-(carboxyamino)imidazole ribonucleotide synthase [Candidatus Saccharimonadales bacterium]